MPSILNTIADALAGSLAAMEWESPGITVERKNWIQTDLEDMQTPVVFVTPGGTSDDRIGRLNWQVDHTVYVYIGRHVKTDADVADMLALSDAIKVAIRAHDYDEMTGWGTITSPQSVAVEINPDDALNDRNTWRAVITATYRTLQTD